MRRSCSISTLNVRRWSEWDSAKLKPSEEAECWLLLADIFPENKASLHIHKKCGFSVLGVRDRLGQMNGVSRDVILLERRSVIEGIEV